MITTIKYNDMGSYSYEQLKDEEFMFNEFKSFVDNGGDLNLHVLDYDKHMISFEKWYVNNIDNPKLFKRLIDQKIIDNPFSFILDHERFVVTDKKDYGLSWLRERFDRYKPYILDAISQLAKDIAHWPYNPILESMPIKERIKSRRETSNTDILDNMIRYSYNDGYSNELQTESYTHPLLFIAKKLDNNNVYETILSSHENYKNLWPTDESLDNFLGNVYKRVNHNERAYLLYKYGVKPDYFLNPENKHIMNYIFDVAIYKNDIEFIKDNLKIVNLSDIEIKESVEDLFLTKCVSREMALILLENGAFTHGNLLKKDNTLGSEATCLTERIHPEVLDTVLERTDFLRDKVKNDPKLFYNLYFDQRYRDLSFKNVQLLIEKYEFPINKFDMLNVGRNYSTPSFNAIEWLIKKGADLRLCKDFISACVASRVDGLKDLKTLQKSKVFNSFMPDPIFNILRASPTKDFIKWLEKSPKEEFNNETIHKFPAWWGVRNNHGIALVADKINDPTQLNSQGLSYFYYMARFGGKTNYEFSYRKLLDILAIKHKNMNFEISGKDTHDRNLFHYLLRYEKYKRDEFLFNETEFLLEHTHSSIGELISQKDKTGQTPLELMLYANSASRMYNVIRTITEILKKGLPSIDYDLEICVIKNEDDLSKSNTHERNNLPTIKVYDAIISMIDPKNKEFLDSLQQHYERYQLHKSLANDLTKDDDKSTKVKIKI